MHSQAWPHPSKMGVSVPSTLSYLHASKNSHDPFIGSRDIAGQKILQYNKYDCVKIFKLKVENKNVAGNQICIKI